MSDESRGKPLISVIITSYNYLRFITTAIDSALAQTYPNLEVVVVDNRSTDGTFPALLERYGNDPRVRLHQNETNLGEIVNSNRGFELSRGAFVNWLSADDWMLPRHLERLHAAFERDPQLDVVHSGTYCADETGLVFRVRDLIGQLPFDYVDARDELLDMLLTNCPLCYPSALWRRSVFEDVGLEDPDGGIHATDWELQVRIALAGKRFAFLAEPSCVVRLHPGQATGQTYVASGKNLNDFVGILEKYVDHPAFAERTRGREGGIGSNLGMLVKVTELFHGGDDPISAGMRGRVASLRSCLGDRAGVYEPAKVRDRLVSVILPASQLPQLAARAIDSIAGQTHGNWEIVVVDHGLTARGELLRSHTAWERMSYVRAPPGVTAGTARNYALRMARGEYLAFLDEDNTFAPEHLATLAAAIAREGTSLAAAGARIIVESADEDLHDIRALVEFRAHRQAADDKELSAIAPALPLNAVMFYRHLLDRTGTTDEENLNPAKFDETLPLFADYEYLLRLEGIAPIAFASAVTLDVHIRLDSSFLSYVQRYLPALDRVYAKQPAPPALAAKRSAHRAAVQHAVAAVAGKGVAAREVAELTAVLMGRSVVPIPPSGK